MTAFSRGSTGMSPAAYGSDFIVDLMRAFDVEYAACNPGATFKWLHDSIVNYAGDGPPHMIECTHEEISVALAHGYAKVAGKPMAAIVHNIVGLQHATMAIYNAWCDIAPIMVLGGTGPMDLTTRRPNIDWLHTALVQGNQIRDYVKWDDQPHNLASVGESFIRGYRVATTEPQGPVYICYDADLQAERIENPMAMPEVGRYATSTPPAIDPEALRLAAGWLAEAQRPVVIADFVGQNEKATGALVELAELLALPVLDRVGRYNFPSTHPLDLTGAEAELVAEADLVLALNVKDLFGALSARDAVTHGSFSRLTDSTKIIQVSMWEQRARGWTTDIQRIPQVDLNIPADMSVALPQLVSACREAIQKNGTSGEREQRRAGLTERHDQLRDEWQNRARETSEQTPVSVSKLAADLWECIKGEDWALVGGNLAGWARRLWDINQPQHYQGGSGGAGLGYVAGAALGGALALKGTGKLCVSLQPDGDFMFSPGALWTAAHHRIPLLTIMYNNRTYFNSEEHAVDVARNRERDVEKRGEGIWISGPEIDYATMARSMGVYGEGPVDRPEEVIPAVQRAMRVVQEQQLPALVDVVCQPR